jgi:hypothetical protein
VEEDVWIGVSAVLLFEDHGPLSLKRKRISAIIIIIKNRNGNILMRRECMIFLLILSTSLGFRDKL